MLKLDFGEGHSWSMNFTVSGEAYQADVIAFSYNLGDKTTFPNSASNGNLYTPQCKSNIHTYCTIGGLALMLMCFLNFF